MEVVGGQGVGARMDASILGTLSTTKSSLVVVGGEDIRGFELAGRAMIFP